MTYFIKPDLFGKKFFVYGAKVPGEETVISIHNTKREAYIAIKRMEEVDKIIEKVENGTIETHPIPF